MARVKFDSGDDRPAGTPYTLDNPAQWGGSQGTFTNDAGPNGTFNRRQLSNPVTADVNRYRQMGDASAQRGAYQLQYGDADADHAQANDAGKLQGDANSILAGQADGTDHITSDFQRGLLRQGSNNQTAGALSTSGGALAQMSALQHANAGRAGYMQRGNAAIAGQQANDMASGRAALAQGTAAQRKGDETGQYLNDQQSQMQAQSEEAQRQLNQNDQLFNEAKAVDTEGQGLQANQHAAADAKMREQAEYNKNQADQSRAVGYLNAGVAAVGNAVAPGVGTVASQAGNAAVTTDQSQDPNNPSNNPDPTSDERAKEKLPMGALAALTAKARDAQAGNTAQRQQIQSSPQEDEAQQSMPSRGTSSLKPRPLLASVDTERGGQSRSLPSDQILDDWRQAHKDPERDQHAPAPSGYDRSMFAKADDGTAPGDADALAAGIEQAHARENPEPELPNSRGTYAQQRQGYYATRRGAVGDVLGRGNEASYDLGFGGDVDKGMAPGTHDALRYGGSEVDGSKNQKGLAASDKRMDGYSKAVMTSDERAKDKLPKQAVVESPRTLEVTHPASDPAGLEQRDAPAKVGEVMTGDRTLHNPTAVRSAARSLGAGQGYERQEKQETPEERTARFAAKAGVSEPSVWDKLRSSVASISDERAKDKGAGGGEEEHDGTTEEHRGPALTEAPKAGGNPLVEMQKHANRMLVGQPYKYKEGFGEDTSQVHHGFMAQNLEQNPITATAVREDGTGIKKVNNEDALRVTAAGVASLQEQHDELEDAVAALAGRRKKRVA